GHAADPAGAAAARRARGAARRARAAVAEAARVLASRVAGAAVAAGCAGPAVRAGGARGAVAGLHLDGDELDARRVADEDADRAVAGAGRVAARDGDVVEARRLVDVDDADPDRAAVDDRRGAGRALPVGVEAAVDRHARAHDDRL